MRRAAGFSAPPRNRRKPARSKRRSSARWAAGITAAGLVASALTYVAVTQLSGRAAPPPPVVVGGDRPEGLHIVAEVLGSGDVRIYERLDAVVTNALRVPPPEPITSLPGVQQALRPEVVDPKFTVDGRPSAATVPPTGGWDLPPPEGDAVHQVEVGYVLRGTTARTSPGPPGRAIVVIEPLLLPHATGMPVELLIAPPFVRGASCPLFPLVESLCANREAAGWMIRRPDADPAELRWIVVQVDLPA